MIKAFIRKYICEILFFAMSSIVAIFRVAGTGTLFKKLIWDEGWYSTIVDYGYMFNGDNGIQHNLPFFPIFPLLAKIFKLILPFEGFHTGLAMLIVSNIFAYLTIRYLFLLTKALFNYMIAVYTVVLFLCLPLSFFIFLGFTESLFFTFILMFLYYYEVKKKRFFPLILISLASLTRVYGILLLVVYLVELFFHKDKRLVYRDILLIPIGVLGLSLFILYFQWKFDHPFLFLANQIAWGHHSTNTFFNFLTFKNVVVQASNFDLTQPQTIGALYFIATIFLFSSVYKLLPRSMFIYTIVFFLFLFYIWSPLSSSIGRYLLCLLPVIMIVPVLLLKDSEDGIVLKNWRFLVFCFLLFTLNMNLLQLFFTGKHFVG